MKKTSLTSALLLITSMLVAQYTWQWTLTEGEEFNETISAIDCDAEGNIYVCGTFMDTIDFFGHPLATTGGIDTYIAAFTPSGSLLWVTQGGGLWEDGPRDICVHDQYLYVTGSFVDQVVFGSEILVSEGARDVFLLKYDLYGTLMWATSDGSVTDDTGKAIAVDENGNIYITGNINYEATFGTHTVIYYGFSDVFLASYDEDGVCLWAKSAGGPNYDSGEYMEVAGEDLFITGGFNEEAVFDTATVSSVDFVDVYIAHYKTDGSFVEVISAGGTNNEGVQCMAVDDDMNIYIAGWYMLDISIGETTYNSTGSYDIFLAKYQPGTGFLWSQSLGGFGLDEATGMTCDINNQLIITGTFEETVSFGTTTLTADGFEDGFMGTFDTEGQFDWVLQAGGTGTIDPNDCASDDEANYYFAGAFVDELIIGGETYIPVGAYDLFLSKLGEGGIFVEEQSENKQISLEIFPNPCSGSAQIRITNNKQQLTKLEVFTIEGRKIKELLNEELMPGIHEVELDMRDLPAGVYYCILKNSTGITTTKLIKL